MSRSANRIDISSLRRGLLPHVLPEKFRPFPRFETHSSRSANRTYTPSTRLMPDALPTMMRIQGQPVAPTSATITRQRLAISA